MTSEQAEIRENAVSEENLRELAQKKQVCGACMLLGPSLWATIHGWDFQLHSFPPAKHSTLSTLWPHLLGNAV